MQPHVRADAQAALVVRLYEAEASMRGRSARIGARLEVAASAMLLLQLASHADAALDDLTSFAEAAEVPAQTRWGWMRVWARGFVEWLADLLWIGAVSDGYRAIVAIARRDIELASSLRAASLASGDGRVAAWCALWIEQRSRLAEALAATLSEPEGVSAGSILVQATR